MVNWKDIHPDFTEELTYEWIRRGFNKEQTKDWLNIGMKVEDAGFCAWLRDEAKTNPEWVLDYGSEALWWEYLKARQKNVYSNFSSILQKEKMSVADDRSVKINELMLGKIQSEEFKLCQECIIQSNKNKNSWNWLSSNMSYWSFWCQSCKSRYFQRSFLNWTSGNLEIDRFIQKCQLEATDLYEVLEWIPYEQFANIKYLAQGGFGTVFEAYWISGPIVDIGGNIRTNSGTYDKGLERRNSYWNVVLKSLNNSQNMTTDFLQEITYHKLFGNGELVVRCYGISQDPVTKNYIMVMKCIEEGNLRNFLSKHRDKTDLRDKLTQIHRISRGLKVIHDQGLVHRDFHSGNILNSGYISYITDLGLSRPVNEEDNIDKVYGVLPYVAPEVLNKNPYTQASDIYSWSIVAYEILFSKSPYHEYAHDAALASLICGGLRPDLDKIQVPQLLKDLIIRCWDADSLKRPTANELLETLDNWFDGFSIKKHTEFSKQYKKIGEFNEVLSLSDNLSNVTSLSYQSSMSSLSYQTHPQAIYTSRLLNFKNLPKSQNSKKINEWFYDKLTSDSHDLEFDINSNNQIIMKKDEAMSRDLVEKAKRQLSISSQTENSREEGRKISKIVEEKEYQSEPSEIVKYQSHIEQSPKK